jgi:hypothetical protein
MSYHLPIRTVIETRNRLIAYMSALGHTITCTVRLCDNGLSLVVNAPTSTHPEIPEEFHGVRVYVEDSV